jgi:ferredoxin
MALREWFDAARAQTPEADPDRCVHAHAEVAACRGCVDACPRNAWVLDDEALAIDAAACNGCGLCVGRCPQNALSLDSVWPPPSAPASALVVSCQRAASDPDGWRLPCVDALGLNHLVMLYQSGVRSIALLTGDCTACPTGSGRRLRLDLARWNQVLAQRGLAAMRLSGPGAQPATRDAGPGQSRREFFRSLLHVVASRELPQRYPDASAVEDVLPPAGPGDLVLFSPRIDPTRCDGCDACVRICPHRALQLAPAADAYGIRADACNGCGLCADVCQRDAIEVLPQCRLERTEVPLRVQNCRACGAPCHWPIERAEQSPYCHVCTGVKHARKLFQVL